MLLLKLISYFEYVGKSPTQIIKFRHDKLPYQLQFPIGVFAFCSAEKL